MTTIPRAPEGYKTVNPFIIVPDAEGLIRFIVEVFGGEEIAAARTVDHDGLLLHAEVRVGDSILMFAERKPGWPVTTPLLQVYVDDVEATLAAGEARGATVVTKPSDFFGAQLSRMLDPWNVLWWVYEQQEDEPDWGDESAWDAAKAETDENWSSADPALTYIHDSLLEGMAELRKRTE